MSDQSFAIEARSIIARSGGVNPRSMRLLIAASHRHGVSIDDVLPAVLGEGHTRPSEAIVPSQASQARTEQTRVARPLSTEPSPFVQLSSQSSPAQGTQARSPLPGSVRPPRPAAAPPAQSRPITTRDATPSDDQLDPAVRTLKAVLTLGSIALVGLVLGLASVWMIVTGLSSPRPSTPAPVVAKVPASATPRKPDSELFPSNAASTPSTTITSDPGQTPALKPLPTPTDLDPLGLVRELTACVELLPRDPAGALRQFVGVHRQLSRAWTSLPPDQIGRAVDQVVEFVYQSAHQQEIVRQAAAAIAAETDPLAHPSAPYAKGDIAASVWSFGVLTRLAREPDLPSAARTVVDAAIGPFGMQGGGSFTLGANAAVIAWPRRLAKSEGVPGADASAAEPWREWLVVLSAAPRDDQASGPRAVCNALETYLADGVEPPSKAVVTELVRAVQWRAGDEARPRLLRWFENSGITSADLAAVTTALVGQSSANGVDATMVLTSSAGEPQRAALREKYAEQWQLRDAPALDQLESLWAASAKAYLEHADSLQSPTQQLARAAVLSRLNASAGLVYVGQTAGVGDAIRDVDVPIQKLLSMANAGTPPQSLDDTASDGAWAIKYLSAERNIPARAALLAELALQSGSIGQIDAEVLAGEAFRGPQSHIRKSAQEIVLKHSTGPAMVNAALEQTATMPRTNENDELVRRLSRTQLPPLKDPTWRAAVRRGLVERLLEMVAARGDQGVIDGLAEMMGDSYRGRAIAGPLDVKSDLAEKVSPEVAVRAARSAWMKWAQSLTQTGPVPVSLDQIQRRVAGRAQLSSGLVQNFAAEQIGVAEVMAFVVATEKPGTVPEVASVLDELGRSRRSADHVFAQMLYTERAMVKLWALRMGVNLQ